jgi:hypothetical protein
MGPPRLVLASVAAQAGREGLRKAIGLDGTEEAYMSRPLYWLWAIVIVALAIPMVVTAGFFFAEEYGPAVAFVVSFVVWAYIAGMTYIALRTIGKMLGRE